MGFKTEFTAVIGFAILFMCGVFYAASNSTMKEHVTPEETAWNAVVQIGNYCSGTVIPDFNLEDGIQTTVITAKHCLSPDQRKGTDNDITVRLPQTVANTQYGYKEYPFKIANVSDKSDLAILQFRDDLGITPVSIYGGLPKFGDEVMVTGFPMGGPKSTVKGNLGYTKKIPYFSDLSKDGWFQYATTLASPGSSGSSMMKMTNDGYQIVGVMTGGLILQIFGYQLYYTPVSEIRTFYNETVQMGKKLNELKDVHFM